MVTPPDIVLLIDTREQKPYAFPRAIRRALPARDYSVLGLEGRIGLERKSLPDLLSVIGQARERFERELARLGQMQFPALIVEASLAEVLQGIRHSALHWNS